MTVVLIVSKQRITDVLANDKRKSKQKLFVLYNYTLSLYGNLSPLFSYSYSLYLMKPKHTFD